MHHRLQELARQAGLEGDSGHFEYDWFDPEKFASLIIQECAQVAHHSHPSDWPFISSKIQSLFHVDN